MVGGYRELVPGARLRGPETFKDKLHLLLKEAIICLLYIRSTHGIVFIVSWRLDMTMVWRGLTGMQAGLRPYQRTLTGVGFGVTELRQWNVQ